MTKQVTHLNRYSEFRSDYNYHIEIYNALYQLKTVSEEELNSIYKKIKNKLIDSKKYFPKCIIRDILQIIPYNNRYTKSYLKLAKLISDDYQVIEVNNIPTISNYLFYKEYGIKLDKSSDFGKMTQDDLDIHAKFPLFKSIMDNDLGVFISFTEREGFDENKKLVSNLYPDSGKGYSLLELCCYHGAVDCFKFLRTKYDSEITQTCLQLSF
ncbi:hypothetical protein TVAG_117990 [Trichomonas vaginalis G3]|uniref:DUF3447 domain-containing protein n=1 Tax=Trichomonas vaginalis (strain ATCC PRA-98 / G3) TaxID=412133 RepID=A2EHY6_TRIV3|nr:protein of unknown function (DUF3447) [Trichomonas vaginalis G3]EAY07718.1 hypothetical protein TVAG_117990 [Trichomonas vaginalis G3]KAI5552562.1 protein of unknown function (DUF3447) [Trichomonas vaginalis G3]|eukprot:XP_001319941.1 hypothetical protein [Trichomonas vaginalis G3]